MENSYLIETYELVKIFPMGESQITALNHVNLQFKKAEFSGLVGPSGSGKTTLLNIIGSLDSPSEGSAIVNGQKIEDLSHKQGGRSAQPSHRIHLPDVQPASCIHRIRKRRIPSAPSWSISPGK